MADGRNSLMVCLTAVTVLGFLVMSNVTAEGNITSSSGNIYLQPAGGNVVVVGNLSSPSITSYGDISIKSSGSTGTYYQFKVDNGGYAHIQLIPNNLSVDRQIFSHSLSNSKIIHEFYMGAGRATLTVRTDDGKDLILGKFNITYPTYPGWGYFGAEAPLAIMVSSDWDDFLFFNTVSNIPRIGVYGGSDVYFYDGSEWENVHAHSFKVHSPMYNGSTIDARKDLSEWVSGKHPLHLTNDNVSQSSIDNASGTDLGLSGQATAKVLLELDDIVTGGQCYDPNVHGSLLERIETLEKRIADLEKTCIDKKP